MPAPHVSCDFLLIGLLVALSMAGCAPANRAADLTPVVIPTGIPVTAPPDGDPSAMGYLLYLPPNVKSAPPHGWPLVLYLHGAGVGGKNPEYARQAALPWVLETSQARLETRVFISGNFIVIAPLAPFNARWRDVTSDLDRILNDVSAAYNVDDDRVYVTGFSMGGYGTWALALAYPDRFAAIAPVGGSDPYPDICDLKDVPVWIVHGALDDVTSPRQAEKTAESLKACGGDVRLTLVERAGHNVEMQVYGEVEIYEWLLEHSR